jgi:hypothetical protein
VVVDCTFLEKSGRHTYGLDWFYNGKTQRAEKGLELSVVAIVDVEQNTGYTLSAQQTEAGLSRSSAARRLRTTAQGNRIEFYLGHLAYCMTTFPSVDSLCRRRWLLQQIQVGHWRRATGVSCDWQTPL